MLTYARHVQAGRFPYIRVSENIELPQKLPAPAHVLAAVADAADAGKALDAFSPPQEPYRRLKAKLAELRGKPGTHTTGHDRQIDTIIVNMERWRWYLRDLGNAHVLVNAPDFMLKVMHDGAQIWTTKVVIGESSKQTPLLSETMKSITVNPTWRVPPSIVQNEYLPAQRRDPGVLARMGLRVSYKNGEVMITQPPGPDNALGRIQFNFPNRLLVYQHDTRRVDRHMFGEKVRAYSHGCMRVQDPQNTRKCCLGSRVRTTTGRPRGSRACSATGTIRTSSCSRPRYGCISRIRPLSWMTRASCRYAVTFTISTAARSQ